MANTPGNVRYGAKGHVYVAIPGGSPSSPTDATGADSGTAPTGFTDLGLVSEDGFSIAKSVDTTDLKAWGAGIVRTSVTDTSHEFSFSLLETNADVMGLWFGADPTVVATTKFEIAVPGAAAVTEFRCAIDWRETIGGATKAFRLFLPRATVTSFEDLSFNENDPVSYGLTLKALSDGSGKAYYVWGTGADIESGRIATGFEID
jgi:hypothetical protein